jgi:hypothetical protein
VPDCIARIPDVLLRGQALETWEAARFLSHAIDRWEIWLLEATPENAVHIGHAFYQQNVARQAVEVLCAHGAAIPSFRGRPAQEILGWFPMVPDGPIDRERDAEFIRQVRGALPRMRDLQREVEVFIDRVAAAPLSALTWTQGAGASADTQPQKEDPLPGGNGGAISGAAKGARSAGTVEGTRDDRATKRPKKSTQPGEAKTKLIAALLRHHHYDSGSCTNWEPVGNNELADSVGVSHSTATAFFWKHFGGHPNYKAACLRGEHSKVAAVLKFLNGDFSTAALFGRTPSGEGPTDDE